MLKISAFHLEKQKSFVPNATKLCNYCDMMFDASNYLYVVKPISVSCDSCSRICCFNKHYESVYQPESITFGYNQSLTQYFLI